MNGTVVYLQSKGIKMISPFQQKEKEGSTERNWFLKVSYLNDKEQTLVGPLASEQKCEEVISLLLN